MRVLHLGSGFRPWRHGGLVAYVEDLMDAQVARGDEVAYFFAGRQYPFLRRPRLRRWARNDVPMYEVVDSPLLDHGRQPDEELGEPHVERLLEHVMDEFRPDVVHLQEVAGLPSSVIGVARRRNVPLVATLQDYFFLCPVFKLSDAHCPHHDVGAGCVATVGADTRPAGILVEATLIHDLDRTPLIRRARGKRRLAEALGRRVRTTPPADAAAFQRRRDLNVERLSQADRVIAMSHRVAELHVDAGVDADRVRTVHLTLAHIERLTPREPKPGAPITFATLAALESEEKGGRLLVDAVRRLEGVPLRVVVFGRIAPDLREAAKGLDAIELRDPFAPSELNTMLDQVDVGLMPSIWEEAYGYAGVEFLAKGIPVIANAIGGMPDYVTDGETGWLNRSCGPEELASIMRAIAENPDSAREMAAKVRARRDEIVKPIARHADEMAQIYAEVVAAA